MAQYSPSPSVVEDILETRYRPGVAKALSLIKGLSKSERTRPSVVAEKINEIAATYGTPILPQYVGIWARKDSATLNKGGMSLKSQIGLGLGVGLSKDPAIAAAMLNLLMFGVWNPDEVPAAEIEALLKSGFKSVPRAKELSGKIAHLQGELSELLEQNKDRSTDSATALARELRKITHEYSIKDIKKFAKETVQEPITSRIIQIFEGTVPMVSDDWVDVSYFISKLTGRPASVDDMRRIATRVANELQYSLV